VPQELREQLVLKDLEELLGKQELREPQELQDPKE
jgi:hypothetical protein